MSITLSRSRATPEETRARILGVAEELFQRMGYAKTTVADIAAALGMSPANVYRFFPSKAAINEAMCGQIMDELHVRLHEIVDRPDPASRRLADLIATLHHHNKTRLTSERRIHEMVEVAMVENWASIDAHCCHVKDLFARLIREGIAAGEFAATDAAAAGETVFQACICLFHPTLITQCPEEAQVNMAPRLIDFTLRALAS